jgi:hypothetical protein
MVAVTVILAAVVAGFVFSAFDTGAVTPQVTFDYNYDAESASGAGDGSLTITVTGGDQFTASQVSFRGVDLGTDPGSGTANAGRAWNERAIGSVGPDSMIGGGQRAQLDGLSDTFELELVWTAESGGSSSTLSTRSGPDA